MSEPNSGFMVWGDWALDYGVWGKEGLSLVNGVFRGQPVFNKLSLPVIRVKYVQDEYLLGASSVNLPLGANPLPPGCGPYNDQISWDTEDFGEDLNLLRGPHHLVKVDCGPEARYLCVSREFIAGVEHRRIGVYARIGAYHINQWWLLNQLGWVSARVASKGLSCELDHWHHPHWRFNFALGQPEVHRVSVHRWNGVKLADLDTEGRLVNSNFGEDIEYRVTSTQPADIGFIERPAKATVRPALRDESHGIVGPDTFCSLDGYLRTYRPAEDRDWPHDPDDQLFFPFDEPCNDTDIVLWSVGHLEHHAEEGPDHWHEVGPDILCEPMIMAGLPAESMRQVTIKAQIDVKDFAAVGDDQWGHLTINETVLVNPNSRIGNVVHHASAGDTVAELIIRLEWQTDFGVTARIRGFLYDEGERVANFEVTAAAPRDSWATANLHLVDYHGGDPDTADMDIKLVNDQAP
jgi:hypothetical protein